MAETKVYRNRNFQIAISASIMVMMVAAAIVPAFPKIVEAFNIDEQAVGLLITAYSLPNFLFGPLGGILADRLGRKKMLVFSLMSFGLFGGGCFFAGDFNTLLILRVCQGIGGAPLAGIGVTIISDLFTGHQRAEAIGLNTTTMYIGYILYPLIGGALAAIAWNYPFILFALAIPIGVIAIIALDCPEPKQKQSLKQYLAGTLHYLKSWKVFWLFFSVMLSYLILYGGFLNYFSIFLAGRFQASPFIIGLFISLVGLLTALTSLLAGRLNKRFSAVSLAIGAFIVYAFSMALIPVMPGLWFCLVPIIIYGFAHGINIPSLTVIASHITPLEHRAGFMALRGMMINLGMTLAPLVMGLIYGLTNLDATFYITGLIALLVPVTAVIIGIKRLSVKEYS